MADDAFSNSTDVLLAHDRWAFENLLASLEKLIDEQLDRPFEIGRGSLRKTIVHMINVVDGWHASIVGKSPISTLGANSPIAECRPTFERVHDAFAATCREKLDPIWSPARGNQKMSAPRAVIDTHILTHGTHHRAQALNMLRQLGVTPLPPSSVLEWMLTTGVAKMS